MNTVDKVIKIAQEEVGYLEKKNGDLKYLYDKTANAGSANYTKYGKEMHDIYPSVMDYPAYWCASFICWIFMIAYGVSVARELLCGNFNDYTVALAQQFKNARRYYKSNPQVGDVIFFNNKTRICHVGLVYKVTKTKVYTIEGNTSSKSGVVANGGSVEFKEYNLTYARIDGYGRPKYDTAIMPTPTPIIPTQVYTKEQFRQDVFAILKVNNINDAIKKSVTISAKKNTKHALVTPLERYFKAWGMYSGVIEADLGKTPSFGANMTKAVNTYQSTILGYKNVDGEITAKGGMWKHMLND